MASKMLQGSPILIGDNRIPGVKIHPEIEALIPRIKKEVRDFGCDYFDPIIIFSTYDEISELAAYGGFPRRYPHWSHGMEYEELARGYEYGMHRISEMVINNSPCYIYCLDSNTMVDNVDVIAHALGHSDFFKNNVFFEKTDRNMLNKMANHGTMVRDYMAKWGRERITALIDRCMMIDTLVDPSAAWIERKIEPAVKRDKAEKHHPEIIDTEHDYMDPWLNSKERLKKEYEKIERQEAAEYLELFNKPVKDIFGFLKDNAPVKAHQRDIMSMLYEEALYFEPQRQTKMLNEGWASYIDFKLMTERGLASLGQKSPDCGIVEYAIHKMKVLGGKYSMNPYNVGFELFCDIEDRWNKGRFGREYDECTDMAARKEWNKNLGLGKQKVFEVRQHYNDWLAILDFFTPEFCNEKEFFEYKKLPNGDYIIENRDFKHIKNKLLKRYLNGGLPDIRLTDPNGHGKGWFIMQHFWDGRPLHPQYVQEVIRSIQWFWKENVVLATRKNDEEEVIYICTGQDMDRDIHISTREDYEREIG